MIEEGLYSYLRAQVAIAELAGDRVFPLAIPQHHYTEASRLACVVYQRIGVSRQIKFCGTDDFVESTFQVDCYAMTYLKAKQLARAVRLALVDYAGAMGAETVQNVFIQTEFDLDDPDPGLYRISQTYSIWHLDS